MTRAGRSRAFFQRRIRRFERIPDPRPRTDPRRPGQSFMLCCGIGGGPAVPPRELRGSMREPAFDASQRPSAGCECRRSTRRDLLALASALGTDAVAGVLALPARAEPADERPKEGDLLVAFDSDPPTPLEPKDIPAGGPQVFAWAMDPTGGVVRKGSRLNKVLLL